MKPILVILAAGMGARYKNLKQIDAFGPNGEMIIDYSIYDAIRAGFKKVVFVIQKNIEDKIREIFDNRFNGQIEIDYVYQESNIVREGVKIHSDRVKPWGTAHAVMVATSKLDAPFAVINADDFYGRDAIKTIGTQLLKVSNDDRKYYMIGYELQYTLSENGYVSRGICEKNSTNYLISITERTNIYKKNDGQIVYNEDNKEYLLKENDLTSMNIFGFTPAILKHFEEDFSTFVRENATNPKSEIYIPTIVNKILSDKKGELKVLPTTSRWFGVTYKEDKAKVQQELKKLIKQGVYPTPLW